MSHDPRQYLRRNPATTTGVSLADGTEIDSVGALPEHRLEMHVFRSSDAAGAFVDGLALAASGNALAWTWEPGTDSRANVTVIVARLDEERPDVASIHEAVAVVEHRASEHDAVAHKAAMDRIHAEREASYARARERTAELRRMAEAAGYSVGAFAWDWVQVGSALVSFRPEGGLVVSMRDGHEGSLAEVRERYPSAAPEGISYDRDEGEFVSSPLPDEAGALRAIRSMEAAVAECTRLRLEAWNAAFVATMRMTPSRRRFLTVATEQGIFLTHHRNNLKAHAGPHAVGPSEFAALVRIGWVARDGRRASVTDLGREAAGLAPAPDHQAPGR